MRSLSSKCTAGSVIRCPERPCQTIRDRPAYPGPIPASAGETRGGARAGACRGAYPRERGGNGCYHGCCVAAEGLSPRARGKPAPRPLSGMLVGPIPASAGETRMKMPPQDLLRAYPRERGGNGNGVERGEHHRGLSPRARGKHPREHSVPINAGPIPASAGETPKRRPAASSSRAYPRERGGNCAGGLIDRAAGGLSPRARGKRQVTDVTAGPPGPIPASAGETQTRRTNRRSTRAYPRERGGNVGGGAVDGVGQGLSPRARGKRGDRGLQRPAVGPIPASAGETTIQTRSVQPNWAYPRERGGNLRAGRRTHAQSGLSPRARGKPLLSDVQINGTGPIPASAGETQNRLSSCSPGRAYPRERGGNALDGDVVLIHQGLSPRARGKLRLGDVRFRLFGPIPASAGETILNRRASEISRAYPRERGGNMS